MADVVIVEITDPTALYCWYDGQGQRQKCEIVLDLRTASLTD